MQRSGYSDKPSPPARPEEPYTAKIRYLLLLHTTRLYAPRPLRPAHAVLLLLHYLCGLFGIRTRREVDRIGRTTRPSRVLRVGRWSPNGRSRVHRTLCVVGATRGTQPNAFSRRLNAYRPSSAADSTRTDHRRPSTDIQRKSNVFRSRAVRTARANGRKSCFETRGFAEKARAQQIVTTRLQRRTSRFVTAAVAPTLFSARPTLPSRVYKGRSQTDPGRDDDGEVAEDPLRRVFKPSQTLRMFRAVGTGPMNEEGDVIDDVISTPSVHGNNAFDRIVTTGLGR